MCLPLKCLKCWVTFSAVLCLILGVVAAIVAGVQMSGVASEHLPDQFANMASGATYAFLAFGILLILIGIAGIIGSIKNIDCCLHIYNIGNCIFFLIFLILAIVLFAAVSGLGNMRDQKQCESSAIFGQWDKWERTAYSTLCTDACKCKVYKNSPLIAQATPANLNRKAPFVYEGVDKPKPQQPSAAANSTSANVSTTAKFSEFAEILPISFQAANATSELSPVRFQQCPDYNKAVEGGWTVSESGNSLQWTKLKTAAPAANASTNSSAPKRFLQAAAGANASSNASANAAPAAPYVSPPLNYNISDSIQGGIAKTFFGSMRFFEDNLECAGVCQKRLFYTFSDVNDHELGAPKDSCGGLLYDGIAKLGRIIAIVSLLIALFLLLNVILAFCLTKQNDKDTGK